MSFKILFFGDIIGKMGRQAIVQALPTLRDRYAPDMIIANVENLAHGMGFTEKGLQELSTAGVNVFTGGNHSWGNAEGIKLFKDPKWQKRILRPANTKRGEPGAGSFIWESANGDRIMIINLMGRLGMSGVESVENPFHVLDTLYETEIDRPKIIFIDMHAEMTAEKEALGHFADGRASAVIGTHTHIQTSDARILTGGTAYCTDAGRCGERDSVLGFEKQSVIERFLGDRSAFYDLNRAGIAEVDGVCIEVDTETGRAIKIESFREILEVF